jgi:hypothetical protein
VGLDDADDKIHTLALAHLGGFEHRVRLADARGGAQEDLQAAAPFLLRRLEERFGRWSMVVLIHAVCHLNLYLLPGRKGAPISKAMHVNTSR